MRRRRALSLLISHAKIAAYVIRDAGILNEDKTAQLIRAIERSGLPANSYEPSIFYPMQDRVSPARRSLAGFESLINAELADERSSLH